MLNNTQIINSLESNMNEIKKFGVIKIGLFGSYARNEQEMNSDIDILVEFEEDQETFENYMDLLLYLEKLLSCKVDLVVYDTVRDELKSEIYGSVKYAQAI